MIKNTFVKFFLLLLMLAQMECGGQRISSQAEKALPLPASATSTPQPSPSPESPEEGAQVSDILTDNEELSYQGFVVEKRYKTVNVNAGEAKEPSSWVEISYAVIKHKGKVLAQFDSVYSGWGNNTRFGLFSFLGHDSKQVIISQDIFRGGNQWIVSLSPHFQVIYDGKEFGAGREGDDMRIVDLDKDGIYEITQPVTAFYGFSSLSPSQTPLPTVIFKYDAKAEKYLPANRIFKDYLLKDTDESKKKVRGSEDGVNHLADILSIVLNYIYTGEESAGWAFYDEAYNLPDKAEMKKKIKAELKDQKVYRFMYRRSGKR